jgi:hypothetical protein
MLEGSALTRFEPGFPRRFPLRTDCRPRGAQARTIFSARARRCGWRMSQATR